MIKTLFSLGGIALAAGIFFLFAQPRYEGIRQVQAEISEYNQALERAAELQQLKQSLLSRYNAFNPSDIERLKKLLPDHVDNVRLVLDLDNLAAKHGLGLQNVVISTPQSGDDSQSAITAAIESTQKYDLLTLQFATEGTYSNFTAFLRDLETSLRIVDLVSLSLAQGSESPPGGEPSYRYDITFRTYWLK